MRYICTYFDKNFLPRGLALYDSLKKNSSNFKFFVLALDNECYEYLVNMDSNDLTVISLNDFNNYFKNNKNNKNNKFKDKKEFYFSLTPSLCLFVLNKHSYIDLLLYLDADVYLFNNIELLYDEIGEYSISMCEHRLPWYIKIFSKNYGIYNVGVNAFRNDEEGNKCLNNWYKNCSEWYPNQEGYPLDFFSDQIWLDKWPEMYKNINILNHVGINVAPWNAQQYRFDKIDEKYFVNDLPLILYHFSSLKRISKNQWHGNTGFTILNIKNNLLEIYKDYIRNILKNEYQSSNPLELKFTGNRIKMFIYKFFKMIHNHIIKI